MSTNKDRIPLPPAGARKTLMTCHFCIVGCGYHVYKWDAHREGGRAPASCAWEDIRKGTPARPIPDRARRPTSIRRSSTATG